MKQISEKPTATGARRVVVELRSDETLMAIRKNSHYRLGDPVGEVIASHILEAMAETTWCSASQEWVE